MEGAGLHYRGTIDGQFLHASPPAAATIISLIERVVGSGWLEIFHTIAP
jgi:hypothetical protein